MKGFSFEFLGSECEHAEKDYSIKVLNLAKFKFSDVIYYGIFRSSDLYYYLY